MISTAPGWLVRDLRRAQRFGHAAPRIHERDLFAERRPRSNVPAAALVLARGRRTQNHDGESFERNEAPAAEKPAMARSKRHAAQAQNPASRHAHITSGELGENSSEPAQVHEKTTVLLP